MIGSDFLLDTNVVIGLLNRSSAAHDIAEYAGIDRAGNAVSQITRIELLGFPRLKPDDETAILNFLADCDVLSIDDRIEDETIAIRRRTKLSLPDAIVAATAVVYGLTLLTLDQAYKKWVEV